MAWLVARRARARTNRPPTRRRQLGFLRLSMFMARWGSGGSFTPQDLFRQGEAGLHCEAYNPNDLLRRRNVATNTGFTLGATGATPTDYVERGLVTGRKTADATTSSGFCLRVTSGGGNLGATDDVRLTTLTALSVGTNYTVRFKAKAAPGATALTMTVQFGSVGSLNNQPITGVYATYSFTATPVAAGHSLFFGGANGALFDVADLEVVKTADAAQSYQPVTDWNTEYLAAALESVGMWQDAAGTTPVTAVEQPVGMWLDGKAGKWVRGPELNDPATWSGAPAGMTRDTVAGTVSFLGTEGTFSTVTINSAVGVTNQWYEIRFTVSGATQGGVQVKIGSATSNFVTTNGTYRLWFLATAATNAVVQENGAAGSRFIGTVSGISIKAVLGNHATQATSGQRPILKALYNTVTSSRISDASWQKVRTGVAVAGTTLTYTAANVNEGVFVNVLNQPSGAWVVTVKASQGTIGSMKVLLKDSSTDTIRASQVFVLTGTDVLYQVAGTTQTTNATTGYRVEVTTNGAAGSINVTGVDVRTADDAAKNVPAFQDVRSTADYDTDGFPHYLKFDGSDDGLATGSVDFAAFDKVSVWAGVTKLSDTGSGAIAELTASSASNTNAFILSGPAAAAGNNYFWRSKGSLEAQLTAPPVYAAPDSRVLTATGDIAGDTAVLRVNGIPAATSAADQGAGTFANAPLYIGRRGGTALPFNGRIYSLTVRESSTPSSEKFIAAMNRCAANLMATSI